MKSSDEFFNCFTLNETHDPQVTSWVDSANDPETDFPIQNLPLGIFRKRGTDELPRMGVAIGDYALDVAACDNAGLLRDVTPEVSHACRRCSLNALMALGNSHSSSLRRALWHLLKADGAESRTNRAAADKCLIPISEVELLVPANIGDYTDFYASIHHATNVGKLLRPDNPLLPNYKWIPIAYHGRASSIIPSGVAVARPAGQTRSTPGGPVCFGPSARLDYEAEIGFFVGPGNQLGTPIPLSTAEQHIFGLCIMNDWSARDIQVWEAQPLGPFLGKSFATTISPWVVTLEALAPFRVPAAPRSREDPEFLPYLLDADDRAHGSVDLALEVFISSEEMRRSGSQPMRLSRERLRDIYWTPAQMVTHHTSNGCNLRPGDLLATGTLSGAENDSRGCLLELTRGGAERIRLSSGETRSFLEDGDQVIMRASCEVPNARRIGIGSCCATIRAANP